MIRITCNTNDPGKGDRRTLATFEDGNTVMVDFDKAIEEAECFYEKYIKSGVGEASQARAKAWLTVVRKDIEEYKQTQRRQIEAYAPNWDKVREELAEIREDWESKLKIGWPEAWK